MKITPKVAGRIMVHTAPWATLGMLGGIPVNEVFKTIYGTSWSFQTPLTIGVWITELVILFFYLGGFFFSPLHYERDCERCAQTPSGSEEAEAKRPRLRRLHALAEGRRGWKWLIGGFVAGMVGQFWIGSWSWTPMYVYIFMVQRDHLVHDVLQPWCPWCRRRRDPGDDFPEWTPPPDPAAEIKEKRVLRDRVFSV